MTTFYWVGGTGTLDNTAKTHIAASSGGAAGAGPVTSADSIVIDSASGSGAITVASGFACVNLTMNGWTASVTNILYLAGNITVTGTLKLLGNSAINRPLIQSSVVGTARNINATAIDAASDFIDFMDISMTGAAFAVGTAVGYGPGNSGITGTTSQTQYWKTTTTGTKQWNDAANWFSDATPRTTPGRVPLPQDNVVFDASSIGAASTTIAMPYPRIGKDVSFTGITNSPTFSNSTANWVFGSLTGDAGMATAYLFGRYGVTFLGRSGTINITFGGKQIGQDLSSSIYGGAATYNFLDAAAFGGSPTGSLLTIFSGTVNTNGYSVTFAGAFSTQLGSGAVVNASTSTITLTGGGGFNINTGTTFNGGSATVRFTGTAGNLGRYVTGGGSQSYGTLKWEGANYRPAYIPASSLTVGTLIYSNPVGSLYVPNGPALGLTNFSVSGGSFAGAKYVTCLGNQTDNISTPDSVASSITGDLEYKLSLRIASVAQTVTCMIMGKDAASPNRGSNLAILTNGKLQYSFSTNGTTSTAIASTVGVSAADGALIGIKVTHDIDNGASGHDVKFYTSTNYDPVAETGTWAQLGATVTTAGALGSLYDNAAATTVLNNGAANTYPLLGRIYRAKVLNGIGGSVVVDCNPADYASGLTWTSSTTGEVWTANVSAHVGADNLIDIGSISGTVATVTKSGGGTINLPFASISRITGSPVSTWNAENSLDAGGNTNVTFYSSAQIAQQEFPDLSAITAQNWMTAQVLQQELPDISAITAQNWMTAQVLQQEVPDTQGITAANWMTAQISQQEAPDRMRIIAYDVVVDVRYLLTHTRRNYVMTTSQRVPKMTFTYKAKYFEETIVVSADFSDELDPGETLTGTPAVTISLVLGVDSAVAEMLVSPATLDVTQKIIAQELMGGLKGRIYELRFSCATTNPEKILARVGRIQIA